MLNLIKIEGNGKHGLMNSVKNEYESEKYENGKELI